MMYSVSFEQQERERARAHRARQQTESVRARQRAWQPQHRRDCDRGPMCPCPQIRAYASTAEQIGYGGAAGGGKSDLQLGFAGTLHQRAIIFRRVFPSLRGMIERSREIFNAESRLHLKDSYNEQLHVWRLSGHRTVEFGSVQYEADLKKYQGQPHDYLGIDEATEFPEKLVRFLMGWNRTATPSQRCRTVLTFNPPMDDAGFWVTAFFAPWLDDTYPEPAEDGELRYVARSNDRDVFYRTPEDAPEAVRTHLKTRTFFHASLRDNPILEATGYGATIEALPEPLRSLLKGNFAANRIANPWQVIPTAWVLAAQARWRERQRPTTGRRAVGQDVARGGDDKTVVAEFVDTWCAPLIKVPGTATPDGPTAAAVVLPLTAGASVAVDIIGVGGSAYDSLRANGVLAMPVNNSEAAPPYARDRSKRLKFRNMRAYTYWLLREALDPTHGDDIALPDDPELRADLCAAQWSLSTAGVQIESKEDIKARLGRSPDCADAVVLAHYAAVGVGSPGV